MLKPQVLAALNRQIQLELTASYDYLAMSAYFDREVLKGFAGYFRKQSEEERDHAMRIFEYIQDSNERVALGPINAPKAEFTSALDAFKHARDTERANTASIHALYTLAVKENDLPTQTMLQWFINEQVEEEKWTEEFVTMAEKIGPHTGALFMFDHRVSKRADKE
ncbi:MAG: ferritin [Bacillota bacterium]